RHSLPKSTPMKGSLKSCSLKLMKSAKSRMLTAKASIRGKQESHRQGCERNSSIHKYRCLQGAVAMSRDRREIARNEARRLRREGISSLQIARILNIPKNTVYKWVRDIELTPEQKRIIQKRRTEAAAAVTRKTAAREEARRLRRE